MSEKAPGTYVNVQPNDIPLALFHLADVMRAVAFGADHHEGRHRSNQERLYAAAKVIADSHPVDSLSNVLMRWLMQPFHSGNPSSKASVRERLQVIDGGSKS